MSFLDDIGSGLMSIVKPIATTLAPMAGTAIGSMFGHPELGGIAGSAVQGLFGGGGGGGAQPQQPQPQQSFGQIGQGLGNYAQQRFANYIPTSMGNTNFGGLPQQAGAQFGRAAGQGLYNRFAPMMPRETFGQMAGNLGNRIGATLGGRLPQQFQQYGQQFGSFLGDVAQRGLGKYGQMSPYGMMQQMPQYGEQMGRNFGRQAGMQIQPYFSRELRNTPVSQLGGYGGRQIGEMIDRRFGGRQNNMPEYDDGAGMREMFDNGYAEGGHVSSLAHMADMIDKMHAGGYMH